MVRIRSIVTRRGSGDALPYRSVVKMGIFLVVGMLLLAAVTNRIAAVPMIERIRSSGSSAEAADSTIAAATPLNLPPGTKYIVLNIGTNVDPILPQPRDGPCALTLAFEPVVPDQIPSHPQVLVVPAAVSDRSSLATMHVYNQNAVSSSLSRANTEGAHEWNQKDHGPPKIVPVVTLQQVLRSIPPDVEIRMLDTDMQGYDYQAVSSALDLIQSRRIRYLKTETHLNNVNYSYANVDNELCRQWLPRMTQAGYRLVGNEVGGQRNAVPGFTTTEEAVQSCRSGQPAPFQEMDAYWVRVEDSQGVNLDTAFDYQKLYDNTTPQFTEAEYNACRVLSTTD